MVGMAFAIAASANFPVLFLSIYWNDLTTKGAFYGGFIGLLIAVSLVLIGPTVWVDILGNPKPIFPLKYPALFSISGSFIAIFIISKLDKDHKSAKHYKLFKKQYYKSYTGKNNV